MFRKKKNYTVDPDKESFPQIPKIPKEDLLIATIANGRLHYQIVVLKDEELDRIAEAVWNKFKERD